MSHASLGLECTVHYVVNEVYIAETGSVMNGCE